MSKLDRLLASRNAGAVKRFHTARTILPESVAEHSFGVVNAILIMTDGQCSKELLMLAIMHDLGETAIGDIPSPVKSSLPREVKDRMNAMEEEAVIKLHPYCPEVSLEDGLLLSIADRIDGLMKCREEVLLGNFHIREIGNRYAEYLENMIPAPRGEVTNFIEECIHSYYRSCAK